MLPSEDALHVGEELARRFGLPQWQFALTATDANRFAIRLARAITGRPKILVFNWCYHGTVDETFATLDGGEVVERRGNIGPPVAARRDDARGRVERRRRARGRARPRRRGLRPRRAGAHEHRHRPARARLPRGAPRADPASRDAAGDRRDAHLLRRPRRLHRGARARPRPAHDRQGDRRRHPRRGLRLLGRDRRRAPRRRSPSTRPTSAGSAAHSPATSSRSPRPARRSARY